MAVLLRHVVGQVDSGPKQSQHEGRGHKFTEIEFLTDMDGSPHLPPESAIAEQRIQGHPSHADAPDQSQNGDEDLQWVGAGQRLRCKLFCQDGVDRVVYGFDARMDLGRGGQQDLRRDGFCAGDQAQGAFQGEGTYQPQGHQPPQHHVHPFGGFFQQEPHRNDDEYQPADGNAAVQDLQKQLSHGLPPPDSGQSWPGGCQFPPS